MSAPVDVLAVMDVMLTYTFISKEEHENLTEARAAFVQMIEAVDQANAFLHEKANGTVTEYRLRKALARVKGGAA